MRKFLRKTVRYASRFWKKHGTTIMIVGCASGTIGAVVEAVKVTPKATKALEEAREEKDEDLTVVETVKTAGKYYIPCGLMAASSIGCAVAGEMTHRKNEAALATTIITTKKAFDEFVKASKEVDDGETHQKIVDKLAEKHITDSPISDRDIVGRYSEGMYKFRDTVTGQYFWSTVERVRKAAEQVNYDMQNNGDDEVDYNTFLRYAGGDTCECGSELGWGLSTTGLIEHPDIGSTIDQENRPCYEISWYSASKPITAYENLPFR